MTTIDTRAEYIQSRLMDYPPDTIVLGVDPSLTSTGLVYATMDNILNPSTTRVHSTLLKTSRRMYAEDHEVDLVWRVEETILPGVQAVIDWAKYNKKEMVCFMEGYALHGNGKVFDLAEVGGAVKRTLVKGNIPIFVVEPNKLKQFIAEKGNASKEMMKASLDSWMKFSYDSNDLNDAYSLCVMGCDFFGSRAKLGMAPLDKFRKGVLKSFREKSGLPAISV